RGARHRPTARGTGPPAGSRPDHDRRRPHGRRRAIHVEWQRRLRCRGVGHPGGAPRPNRPRTSASVPGRAPARHHRDLRLQSLHMRLTSLVSLLRRATSGSVRSSVRAALLACGIVLASAPASAAPQDPEDILGELIVEARGASQGPIRLPKIEIDFDDDSREAKTAGEVLRRDLALSAEFDVVDAGLPARSNMAAWRERGAQAVVRVRSERAGLGTVRLIATLELPAPSPAVEITLQAPQSAL